MTVRFFLMRIHAWLALIVGAQILLWVVSGLVMTWFPIDTVRGQHLIRETPPVMLDPAAPLAAPGVVILAAPEGVLRLTLRHLMGTPIYELQLAGGEIRLADAVTGALLPPLSEAQARAVAEANFGGEGRIVDAELLSNPSPEDRADAPVWRLQFDDPDATRLFVSPQTGNIVARRTSTWRLFDFFWMLHIMDYDEREDFNHPVIIIFSAVSVIVALSGLPLLWWGVILPRIRRRRQT